MQKADYAECDNDIMNMLISIWRYVFVFVFKQALAAFHWKRLATVRVTCDYIALIHPTLLLTRI